METLWILLAAIVSYLALWIYFDACRQRDAYQIGLGPRGLPPNTWAALVFFFAPVAAPLYLKAKDAVPLEASPRSGAPPVFESRGLNLYGWLGLLIFLGATGWLAWEKETLLAALALVLALVAAFGGRTIRDTDRALRIDLPAGATWEQVGFRPLPREEDQADEDEEEHVLNLDRLPPPPSRPAVSFPLPAPAAPAPAVPQARPPATSAQSSVRISDILWAASEDGFDDGGSEPALPGAGGPSPHATVAADPALFRQLGGIFAPPGAAPPPRLPPSLPAAQPLPPPQPIPPSAVAPRFVPTPSAPPSPASAPPAGRLPPSSAAPTAKRTAPPIAGAYAVSPSSESKLPLILGTIALVAVLSAASWYFLGKLKPAGSLVAAAPEPSPAAENAPVPAPVTAPEPPTNPAGAGGAGPAGDPMAAVKSWMLHYLELFGPLGQNLDEVDFEGFSPDRCAQLRSSLAKLGELPPLPEEQLHFELSACVLLMSYLPDDCDNSDIGSWCSHLTESRQCMHQVQQKIESNWGLPGLLEFQISDNEPRSPSSMSGRCLAESIEARSRAVEP